MTNNSTSTFNYSKFLIQLVVYAVVLYGVHSYVVLKSFTSFYFHFEIWEIYAFQLVTVALVIFFLNQRKKSNPSKVLSTYLILSMLKMALALLFLLPFFLDKSLDSKPTVFSFFAAFFLFLFLETRYALKILSEKN